MKKIYTLLALLLLTLGSATAYADAPDWAKNKAITTVSAAMTGTITEGNYILYQSGSSWNKYLKEGKTLGAQLLAVSKPDDAPEDVAYVVHIAPSSDNSSYFSIQLASGNYIGQFTFSGWGASVVSSSTAGTFTIEEVSAASGYYNIKSSTDDYWLNINSSGPVTWTEGASDATSNSAYQILPVELGEGSYCYHSVSYIGKDSEGTVLLTSPTYILNDGASYPTGYDYASVDGFYEITGEAPTGTVTADKTIEFTFSQANTDAPKISSSADDATWYGIKARDNSPLIAMNKIAQGGIYCNPFASWKITDLVNAQGASLTYNDIKNAQLWRVTGDPFNGFRLINKYNNYALAVGAEGASGKPCVMRAITNNKYSLLDIKKVTVDDKEYYEFKSRYANNYVSDFGGVDDVNLKWYNIGAAGDGGSRMLFTKDGATDITTSNIEAAEIYSNHGWPGDTKATITVPESTTNTGEALFNEVFSINTVAIESGKYYKIYCNRSDVGTNNYQTTTDTRYVSTETSAFHADGTLTVDNYDDSTYPRTLTRVPASSAEVPKLWQLEEQSTAGTYKIKNANTGLYWSNAAGSPIDQPLYTASEGVFTPTAVSGVAETWQLVYGSTHYVNAYSGMEATTVQNYDSSTDAGGYWAFIPVTTIPLVIYSDTQYASAKYPFAVTLPEGLTAYVISATTGSEATLTAIGSQTVPANTPVLISTGEEVPEEASGSTTYTLTISSSTDTYSGTNLLDGATVKRTGFEESANYVLAAGPKLKSTGTVKTIPANKAYLPASNVPSSNAQALSLTFGETTGIEAVTNGSTDNGDAVYYDLNGRRVLYPVHGIFVKGNGQKVYIK